MEYSAPPRYIVAGPLTIDFRVLPRQVPLLKVPGGAALYAAAGLRVWTSEVGLLSRVGCDYPREWVAAMEKHDLNTRGISILPSPQDVRFFAAYNEQGGILDENPVGIFARLGSPFPKELLDYSFAPPGIDNRTLLSPLAVRAGDIPSDYLDAAAAHICPMDFLAQQLLPSTFRQGHITTITLDPSPGAMNPVFWNDIPSALNGLTAFLAAEDDLRTLFQGKTDDIWEMAETLAHFGCEIVVIRRGTAGQLLYDASRRRRWAVPAYPARLIDPTGAGSAFSGGFLAGWRSSYDPLQAVLQGNISASLVIESSDVFYAMDAMPGLGAARLEALKSQVRIL